MSDFNPVPDLHGKDEEPWWNDKDKIGGMAATVVVIALLVLIVALIAKFIIWLF